MNFLIILYGIICWLSLDIIYIYNRANSADQDKPTHTWVSTYFEPHRCRVRIPTWTLDSFMWGSYPASLRNVGGPTRVLRVWNNARKGLPPPVKLESRHNYNLYCVDVTQNTIKQTNIFWNFQLKWLIVLSRLEYEQVHLKYLAGLKVIVISACKINCSLFSLDLYRKLQVVIFFLKQNLPWPRKNHPHFIRERQGK
jgi:hypothetical protein